MTKIEIKLSKDGSHTLYVPALNEHYHSVNGAVNEAMHVFIQAGLKHVQTNQVNILEFGFGTGLNAFLSAVNSGEMEVHYCTLEKYPLDMETIKQLNYGALFDGQFKALFKKIHQVPWGRENALDSRFFLTKQQCDFTKYKPENKYHIIYFDAFAPDIQPKLWSSAVFQKAYNALLPGGVLTTYCAKGIVRRTMQDVGFKVERMPGPPGKREMLRAIKI
ncbi:tRNA U34 5-methylaminomethyl-2-thiouridine-forming methyltransferase MnmC [Saccharicrinis carchari]|uniref:tRNA U34 5-methylaminomethyl-2-thiouridine-forming methyltransferase MnmC n=1 Tax=Saccharicrinis carchari TaxID=1168039 RepID=A0A521BI69_SACCC|nr:tRNA (5-methylaminomethyl-2-thiouridine)(34)-methyltransferase MnmD [Saccharicrinis carchari]SMO46380.1 tRNA U34 5-methylaminomethyl-2-thiouridine-forming methyltransferase MnmC [Saccharicrinis carchari]